MKFQLHFPRNVLCILLFAALCAPLSVQAKEIKDDWPVGPEIASASGILLEPETGTILYEKAMDESRSPAGAVKIMTVLLALENSEPTDEVTFTKTGLSAVVAGSANIAAREGEILTMEQCLYAAMLSSANDVCMQVAEHVGGSVEAFVELMNGRAKELGCTNTVFTNPTGLADENQHTTAHDLALLLAEAMENPTFCQISLADAYTIPATNKTAAPRNLKNTLPLLGTYEGLAAGKASYTQASLGILAAGAQREDLSFICVVLAGQNGQYATDAASLLDYGFGNFSVAQYTDSDTLSSGGTVVLPKGADKGQISVRQSADQDEILEQYYYGSRLVGEARLFEEPEEIQEENSEKEEAAADYMKEISKEKSPAPYYMIFGVWLALMILLGVLLRKVLRK